MQVLGENLFKYIFLFLVYNIDEESNYLRIEWFRFVHFPLFLLNTCWI